MPDLHATPVTAHELRAVARSVRNELGTTDPDRPCAPDPPADAVKAIDAELRRAAARGDECVRIVVGSETSAGMHQWLVANSQPNSQHTGRAAKNLMRVWGDMTRIEVNAVQCDRAVVDFYWCSEADVIACHNNIVWGYADTRPLVLA